MSSGGSRTSKSKPLSPTYSASSSSELDPVCRTQVSGPAASSRPAAGEMCSATCASGARNRMRA
jgi:hypothetical protein